VSGSTGLLRAPDRALRRAAGVVTGLLREHRILRFLLVGGLNTLFGYSLFLLCLVAFPTTFIALVVSTVLGILFNFRTTGQLVFGSRDPRRLLMFFGVYGIVFLYNAIGLEALGRVGVAAWLAGLVLLPGAVALSYFLNARFVFRSAA
jgi:putative flippase GtrA